MTVMERQSIPAASNEAIKPCSHSCEYCQSPLQVSTPVRRQRIQIAFPQSIREAYKGVSLLVNWSHSTVVAVYGVSCGTTFAAAANVVVALSSAFGAVLGFYVDGLLLSSYWHAQKLGRLGRPYFLAHF